MIHEVELNEQYLSIIRLNNVINKKGKKFYAISAKIVNRHRYKERKEEDHGMISGEYYIEVKIHQDFMAYTEYKVLKKIDWIINKHRKIVFGWDSRGNLDDKISKHLKGENK